MLQSHLQGEAFRGNPNVPPTPSMDLDAFLMWGSKLILFAKKICACVIYGDWMNLQVEWLRLQDVVMPEAMAVHGRSRPRSMYNEHQSFYYVIETSTTYEKPTNSGGSLIQDDPRLKFFICFDPGIQSTSFVGNQAHRSSPVACEVSYLRNPLDEGRQVRVKKQLAVISWFGIHETMKNTWSQEMLRIFQRQNVSFPLPACCDTDIIWVHQQIRLNTLHQESWI